MASSEKQNVWFGVSMFLCGLIAGVILVSTSGINFLQKEVAAPTGVANNPTAPSQPTASAKDRMIAYAAELDLPEDEYATCLASTKYDEKITLQQTQGSTAGVNGTPGNIVVDMKTGKGILVSGAQPVANFKKVIDAMLKDPAAALKDPAVQLAGEVTPVDVNTDHIRGSAGAKVAVIEYSDYQCPFCHSVHPTYQQLLKDYGDQIMWVYRHFPLTNIHPDATPLAIGAECARELGGAEAFWGFTDKVMAE